MKEKIARPILPQEFADAFEEVSATLGLNESERVFLIYALDYLQTSVAEMCWRAEEIFGFAPKTDTEIETAALMVCPKGYDTPSAADMELLRSFIDQPRCDILIRAVEEVMAITYPCRNE
ncbi:MAG TPA: hypothetical protein VMV71_00400 [Candidatus Paceibacterota bacterium]|nr:hypothetical protein [Candidatus Paceibacterota bacterium]